MNAQPKHDWREVVLRRISPGHLPAAQCEEIISELAAHLEEVYEAARSCGLNDSAALNLAMHEVVNWTALAGRIRRAKSTEGLMSQLTKRFVLTVTAVLWVAGVVLVLLDRAALVQRLIWIITSMGMLVYAIGLDLHRLDRRTRCFWLPGFITLIVAVPVLLTVDFVYNFSHFFREITLHPQDVIQWNAASPRLAYIVWLLAQMGFGAIGAYFSRRAGGTRTAMLIGGAFPAIVLVGTYVLMVPVTCLISGDALPSQLPSYLSAAICVWVLAPALSIALGAAPFLRSNQISGASPSVV